MYEGNFCTDRMRNGPISCLFKVAIKYGMGNILRRGLLTGDFGNYDNIKKNIKQIMWDKEEARWRSSCFMYKELEIYSKHTKVIKMHGWWHMCKHFPYMFR